MKRNLQHSFEHKIVKSGLLLSLLPTLIMLVALYHVDISIYLKTIIVIFTLATLAIGHLLIFRRIQNQIRSTTNLVEALTTGDSTIRPNSSINYGTLSELNRVINAAAEHLAEQRLVSKEHHIAMSKILEHINVAVICLDDNQTIHLVNPKAQQLFNVFDDVSGVPAKVLGIEEQVLSGDIQQVVTLTVGKVPKRVFLQTDQYQLHGKTYTLLFFNDVQKLLQNEERVAWQRLLRVLSHEINNSLAPIASIGESLNALLDNKNQNSEQQEALKEGLAIITNRALSLNDFIREYQSLARLPAPDKKTFSILSFIKDQIALFGEVSITYPNSCVSDIGNDIELYADTTQLAQVFVNLIQNAQQAINGQCEIEIQWQLTNGNVQISIEDNGCGISNVENLFIPFYTTKPGGNGIGLVFSRQIMFNHGGDLTLKNREKGSGAIATLTLPA